ncbi:transglycosylase SLT domain-containing protein [Bacteriovorax sp. PP10]|uniref:Transglycosylase SLT domain-containing protein n=1 Tax=Bacteriovorax antarcticus TaxID=3088717 RepID=A0ABU5VSG7_9BACT|nr:transglycosylase SLT domain-containing protein [Bacteriovorax sp. PP10]MEA9356005.1 transglycosylase SLT domain-containing protein [Bacteriovorax sp. PP10]
MKTIIINFTNRKDKELIFKVALLSTLAVGVYLQRPKNLKIEAIKINSIYNDNYGDFDRENIPNKPPVIAKMISALKPGLSSAERHDVAMKIHHALKKHNIAPQIVVAIIDTESSFTQNLVSSTGDLSMAQVNVEIWNKEFQRMNLELIDVERVKTDEVYSLEKMAQILEILKTRYEKKDRRWYARYHSKTKKHKRVYLAKLESRMKRLEKLNLALKKPTEPRLVAQVN